MSINYSQHLNFRVSKIAKTIIAADIHHCENFKILELLIKGNQPLFITRTHHYLHDVEVSLPNYETAFPSLNPYLGSQCLAHLFILPSQPGQ